MNKKSGTAGTPVDPIAPPDPHAADDADPGEVEKVKADDAKNNNGKYSGQKVKPFKPVSDDGGGGGGGGGGGAGATSDDPSDAKADDQPLSWIEIELVGEDDKPISGERYRITLPDNSVDEGTLDQNGWARVAGFVSGECKVTFPDLDQDAWEFVKSTGPKQS